MSKIQRSYARIMWRKNDILGLQMINSKGHQFFIYAEPLLCILRNEDKYVRIKRRNNYPSRMKDYHQGEIYGRLTVGYDDSDERYDDSKDIPDEDSYYCLNLYLGASEKRIRFDASGKGLLEVVGTYEFIFPKLEFNMFRGALEAMLAQRSIFSLLGQQVDILTLEPEFDDYHYEPLVVQKVEDTEPEEENASDTQEKEHDVKPKKKGFSKRSKGNDKSVPDNETKPKQEQEHETNDVKRKPFDHLTKSKNKIKQ